MASPVCNTTRKTKGQKKREDLRCVLHEARGGIYTIYFLLSARVYNAIQKIETLLVLTGLKINQAEHAQITVTSLRLLGKHEDDKKKKEK